MGSDAEARPYQGQPETTAARPEVVNENTHGTRPPRSGNFIGGGGYGGIGRSGGDCGWRCAFNYDFDHEGDPGTLTLLTMTIASISLDYA